MSWKWVLLVAAAALAAITLIGFGIGAGWSFGALGVVGAAIVMLNVRDGIGIYEPSAWRPKDFEKEVADQPSIDLDDELHDLLFSAARSAERRVELGQVVPFVMYETADGDVKVREIREPDEERWMARTREAARALEDARRVVSVVPATVRREGEAKRLRVLHFEAAEQGLRERTLAFVQGYRPKAFLRGGTTTTRLQYIGDSAHTLRFRVESATRASQGSTD